MEKMDRYQTGKLQVVTRSFDGWCGVMQTINECETTFETYRSYKSMST